MKKVVLKSIFILLSLFISETLSAQAALFWKCGTSAHRMPGSACMAHFNNAGCDHMECPASVTCTNWVTGATREELTGNSINVACFTVENTSGGGYLDYIDMLAQDMENLVTAGIAGIDPLYTSATELNADPALVVQCLEFRCSLSGYDVDLDDPNVANGCTPWIVTLPVIVPAAHNPPIDPSCISISPIPATSDLTIHFNGHENNVDQFQLIELNTGIVVMEKSSSIQPLEVIIVSGFTPGVYSLRIYNGLEIHNQQVMIN